MSNQPRRDESVERLLRSSMRDALPGPPETTTACIEAETLAAWADGALATPERERVETHVSSCTNCQALLAVFAKSLPEPAGSAAAVAPGFWTPWRWGWLAAATTAAVAVTVWISVPRVSQETPAIQVMASRDAAPEPGPLPTGSQAKEEQAPLAPSSNAPAGLADGRSAASLEKSQSPRREVAIPQAPPRGAGSLRLPIDSITEVREPATEIRGREGAAVAAPAPMSSPPPPPPPAVQPKTPDVVDAAPLIQAASGERSTTVRRQQLESLPAPGGADHNFLGYVALQPGVSGNNRIAGGGQANFMLDGLSAIDAGNQAVVMEIIPSSAIQPAQGRGGGGGGRGGRGAGQPAGSGAQTAAAAPVAPVPVVTRWRVFANGQVDRVTQEAPTGERVVFAPPVAMTAGSAPNALVCWLVGRGGAIALTIDAEHFRSVAFPETTDLRSIAATSALQATVTTVLGVTYSTADGGANWRLVSR